MKRFPFKLLAILPVLILLWLVWRYGVNLPVWDEWDTPGTTLVHNATQQMTWSDWIRQHNESRKLFPRLLLVPLAGLTSWNIRSEMLISVFLACLISFNVYCLSKTTLNCSPRRRLAYLFLANLLIFSPMQWDNWLRGIQAIAFVPIACITGSLAVIVAANPLVLKFLVSGILATIATFSLANGMLSWIIILPSLILVTSKTKSRMKIGFMVLGWLALLGFNLGVYLHNYIQPALITTLRGSLFNPLQTIANLLSFMGSPLGFYSRSANQLIGLITIGLFSAACFYVFKEQRHLLARALPWISIGVYGFINCILIIAGGVSLGMGESLESRYITLASYSILALLYLLIIISENLNQGNLKPSPLGGLFSRITSLLLIACLLVYPANLVWGANRMIAVSQERLFAKACLIFINHIDSPECLQSQIFPQTDFLKQRATELNSLGYLQPALATSDRLNEIDGQNLLSIGYGSFDGFSRDDSGNYLASGWSILPKYSQPAHAVILAYQTPDNIEHAFALAKPEVERPDLVDTLGKQQYLKSGWTKSFPPELIPGDAIAIGAWAFDSKIGRAYKLNVFHPLQP
ncbi:MAG: hypothetical protein AAFQ80_17185 [Cyanobacteria bacterium J06621_8]